MEMNPKELDAKLSEAARKAEGLMKTLPSKGEGEVEVEVEMEKSISPKAMAVATRLSKEKQFQGIELEKLAEAIVEYVSPDKLDKSSTNKLAMQLLKESDFVSLAQSME